MAAGKNQITDKVMKGQPCEVAEFGANGAQPQTKVTLSHECGGPRDGASARQCNQGCVDRVRYLRVK